MAQIADADNLRLAFWKAAKGKRGKADCLAFRERLDENLAVLGAELLAGDVPVGDYHYFKVHDPKERLICAATFRERVLHHALMNVCEPVLERAAVFDSYACRKGKGRLLAVERAQGYARTRRWFLKMDIRKYFDSIHQATLRELSRPGPTTAATLSANHGCLPVAAIGAPTSSRCPLPRAISRSSSSRCRRKADRISTSTMCRSSVEAD